MVDESDGAKERLGKRLGTFGRFHGLVIEQIILARKVLTVTQYHITVGRVGRLKESVAFLDGQILERIFAAFNIDELIRIGTLKKIVGGDFDRHSVEFHLACIGIGDGQNGFLLIRFGDIESDRVKAANGTHRIGAG